MCIRDSVWKALPDFPRDVPWFRGINIFLGSASLCMLHGLYTRGCSLSRTERTTLLFLVAVHPAMLFYSTSIHTEPLYLLISGGILWYAVVQTSGRPTVSPWIGFWLGLLTGLLLYVRLAGITLALAVLLYFLVLRRYRNFLQAALTLIVLVTPWLLWVGLNSTETSYRGFTFYSDYFRDWGQVVRDHGLTELLWTNGISLFFGIPKTCFFPFQTDPKVITQLAFWLGIPFHYFLWRGFVRTWKDGVNKLFHLYTISSLAVFLAWPYMAQERFLGTLLPFLYLFFLKGTRSNPSPGSVETPIIRRPAVIASWSMAAVLLISLGFHSLKYDHAAIQNQSESEQRRDAHACFAWLREKTAAGDTLMADLDLLFYLHTDRKTLPLAFVLERKQGTWTFSDTATRKAGASYLVAGKDDFLVVGPSLRSELQTTIASHLEENPLLYRRVFTSPQDRYQIYSLSRGEEPSR